MTASWGKWQVDYGLGTTPGTRGVRNTGKIPGRILDAVDVRFRRKAN